MLVREVDDEEDTQVWRPKSKQRRLADAGTPLADAGALVLAVSIPSGLADSATHYLFGEMPIVERFGALEGILMIQKIMAAYQDGDRRTCPFYVEYDLERN